MFLMPMSAVGFGAHYGVTGYEPAGALMLDGSADYLTQTFSTSKLNTKGTYSFWIKRSVLGTSQTFFSVGSGGSGADANWFTADWDSSNQLNVRTYDATRLKPTQVFRDPTAWQHFVIRVDTTDGTAGDRLKIYLNGAEITAFATDSTLGSSANVNMSGNGHPFLIGQWNSGAYFSGYIADFIFIDDTELDASSFGETDSDTGIWVPKDPSALTFGTNGFWLDFADGNNIGRDAANGTTTAATVTGASGIWSGDTGSFTFSGDDLQVAAGDKGIYTTDAYLGNVVVTGVWHGDFSEGGIAFAKYSANLAANFSSGATFGIHTGQRLATVLNQSIYSVKLHFHDFENALENRMTNVSPEATSATDPSGEDFEWRRSAAGVVTFKLGSTTIFTGNDRYTGPVHVLFGNHGTYTSPIDIDDLSIAHEGLAGNRFVPQSMGANNTIAGGPSNSTTKEITLYPTWNVNLPAPSSHNTYSNNNMTVATSSSSAGTTQATIGVTSGHWYWEQTPLAIASAVSTGVTAGANTTGSAEWVGKNTYGIGLYSNDGGIYYNAVKQSTPGTYTVGDVIGVELDLDAGTPIVKFTKNGSVHGSFNLPANFTGGLAVYPSTSAADTSAMTATLTTDANSFKYSIPTGASALTKTITGVGNASTFNSLLKTTGTFSNGNLTFLADSQSGFGHSITSTHVMTSGTYYAEFVVDSWSGTNHATIGIATTDFVTSGNYASNWTGANTQSWGYYADGSVYTNNSGTSSGYTSYTLLDIIGVKLDATNGAVYFYKNGVVQNSGSAAYSSLTGPFVFSVSNAGGSTHTTITANFGQKPFIYQPSSTSALATHNLPTPAVLNYEDEYFIKANISHTNGSTTAVTLPKTVSGGAMVRIKRTDSTSDWYVVDTVRGVNKYILWNEQDAEDTSTWSDQNLTSTTLTLPSALASGTYLIECFYVGSYFQIKAFTGNASATAISFDSALSGEFGAAFVKNRTDSGSPGASFFQHKSLGGTKYLHPYSTDDVQTNSVGWNDTAASTTQITVGTHNGVNGDGDAMIVYAWANSGPYRFGEVTSNDTSGNDFMVNVGGFPQTKFVKKHNAAEGWYFSAFAIDGYNPTKYMNLNSDIAAAPDVAYDHLSNGFKSRDTTTSTRGKTGSTFHELVWGAFGIQPIALNNRAR